MRYPRMTDKVLCPWCGNEMVLLEFGFDSTNAAWLECVQCGAHSPMSYDHDGTEVSAINAALAAALRRYEPPVRPLTLEELIDSTDGPVYIESQKREDLIGKFTAAVTCHRIIWSDGTESNLDRYGKTWRCWPRKPTDEEREAAGWEDAE